MRNLHPDLSGLTNISDVLESLHLAILSIRDPIQWAVERHKAQEQEKTQQKWKETFIQWTKQGYFLFHLINQEHHDWLSIQYQESLIWIRGTEELRRLLIHHYFIRLEDVPHPRKRKLPSLFVAGEDNSQQEIRKTKYQKKSHVPTPTISKKQSIPFYFSKAVPDLHTLPKVDTPTTSFSFCAPSAPILHRSLRALDRIWQGVREAVERTSHNWKEGSRMGEAKNPGPAYTTLRRRLNTRNLSPNPNQPIDNTMPFDSRYWSPPRRWEPPHRANPPVRPYVGGKQESRDGRSGCLSSSSPPYGRNLLFRNRVNKLLSQTFEYSTPFGTSMPLWTILLVEKLFLPVSTSTLHNQPFSGVNTPTTPFHNPQFPPTTIGHHYNPSQEGTCHREIRILQLLVSGLLNKVRLPMATLTLPYIQIISNTSRSTPPGVNEKYVSGAEYAGQEGEERRQRRVRWGMNSTGS